MARAFAHDVFFIHAEADERFVRGYLIPELGLDRERVQLLGELDLGQVIVDEIERMVQSSRITIAVLSPAYKADRWALFGEQLAAHARVAENDGRQLLPLLRMDCDVPDDIAMLVGLDFRDSQRETWSTQAARLRELLGRPDPVVLDVPCPYPGMRPFTEHDQARFFGRDDEIEEIVGRLERGERDLYIIGASGSGKSSLVAAGLIPRLQHRSDLRMLVRSLRPGERPAARLAQALAFELAAPDAVNAAVHKLLVEEPSTSSLLLVVDQLEELFSVASQDERTAFLNAVRALQANPRCVLLFTLRADFYGVFMESTLWTDLSGRVSRVELGALRGDNLRAVIERPAAELGVYVERDLVERLLGDTAAEPGALPLLQEALRLLWGKRRQRLLTLSDYLVPGEETRSGLARAVSDRADTTLRQMTSAQEATALRILLRLVAFGEGRADTRRQQARSVLRSVDEPPEHFDTVLQRLVNAHLLTATGDDDGTDVRVDLAHEILIHAWPTLAKWIQTWRADEQYRRRLEDAARAWCAWGSGERGLLEPDECTEAVAWRTRAQRQLGESASTADFIAASQAFHMRSRRQRRRRVQIAFASLTLFVLVTSTLAFMAWNSANEADKQRSEADHERQDAIVQSKRADDRDRESRALLSQYYENTGRQLLIEQDRSLEALPYLLEARKLVAPQEPSLSLRTLFAEATRSVPLFELRHNDIVNSAAFSPDGSRVVTASHDRTVRIWDSASGKPVSSPLLLQDAVTSAEFSPDGTRVVTASHDNVVCVWDVNTNKPVAPPFKHEKPVTRAVFSPDGVRVITTSADIDRIWEVASGKLLSSAIEKLKSVKRVVSSPDGTRVVVIEKDKIVRVLDAMSGRPLLPPLPLLGSIMEVGFSPDGSHIVSVAHLNCTRFTDINCTPVHIWEISSGKAIVLKTPNFHLPDLHLSNLADNYEFDFDMVDRAMYAPDGLHVVTFGLFAIRMWDAVTGDAISFRIRNIGSSNNVMNAEFNADSTRIMFIDKAHMARAWDIASGKALSAPLRYQGSISTRVFSPDGTRLVTAGWGQSAFIWSISSSSRLPALFQHQRAVENAEFSPDGTRVVTASVDHTARIWDATTGKPLSPPLEHQGPVNSAAFSPDGTRVITASGDHTARIWDGATGKPLSPPLQHQASVNSAAFSFDSKRVVTAYGDGLIHVVADGSAGARVWEAASGRPLSPLLLHQKSVRSAAFSADGTRVATASYDDTARIWDSRTGKLLAPHFGIKASS